MCFYANINLYASNVLKHNRVALRQTEVKALCLQSPSLALPWSLSSEGASVDEVPFRCLCGDEEGAQESE